MSSPTTQPPTPRAETAAISRPEACPVNNRWVRRIGAAGFLFFLIKGLLWLTVPAAIAAWRWMAN